MSQEIHPPPVQRPTAQLGESLQSLYLLIQWILRSCRTQGNARGTTQKIKNFLVPQINTAITRPRAANYLLLLMMLMAPLRSRIA
ncbi:MAG: hypothetical protein QOJ42_7011 [Acidobacteriaceae bacterium]|nr:hypothetical protein [Acidobacteriaceae bacterium]